MNSYPADTNHRRYWLEKKVDLNQLPPSTPTTNQDDLYAPGMEDMTETPPPGSLPLPGLVFKVVINPEVLAQYNARFKQSIDLIRAKYDVRTSAPDPDTKVPDLPIYMVKRMGNTMLVPRIAGTKNKLSAPQRAISIMSTLIKCVLFSHRAFLKSIDTEPEEISRRQDSLIDWLFERCLSSNEQIPIFGDIVAADYNLLQPTYKPIQRHLINYIHGSYVPQTVHTAEFTSHVVIAIWYKQKRPTEWTRYFNDKESIFWRKMQESLAEFHKDKVAKSGLRTEAGPSDHRRDWGNFKIADLEKALTPLTSKRWWMKANFIKFKRSYERLKYLERIIIDARRLDCKDINAFIDRRPMVTIPSLPYFTGLQYSSKVNRGLRHEMQPIFTVEKVLQIRLICSTSKSLEGKEVDNRLVALISVLSELHHALNLQLPKLGKPPLPNSQPSYLDWLAGVLFDKKESYPILGSILEHEISSYPVEFTPIQQQVIYSLTSRRLNTQQLTDIAGFLGYWCKNYQEEYWTQHFKDEADFGEIMLGAIISAIRIK
ncbi:hypothetical protein MJO28_001158 [Puccinia striiformis f. sp. tritici]|uniref:Uncharacterized protein n=1 Tax=Puccinia striiformis f. sp. tritici TaxID=168172 RepID=A0ACC0F1N1_9BASI|nr:hypothetical protein Pst134EA_000084 [Puccinia striiformis f. sp. tritici]KAH9473002.1 hypothetical protein Pst134EA_000084 [Puccinia striiformis f. sp. tritici]KAI7963064.1 hypothetical protein MJO28_001158 [Puccinia striiformis f. sp. tritici]KAI9604449.1 hypothetical protein KEM48_000684 [Puccinia striiformis f. sp. tritici PST-130]